MKFSIKNLAVTVVALIVVVSLAGCGGSSKTWPSGDRLFFAYLADNSTIPTPTATPAPHSALSARARQMTKHAHHAAGPRANAGVDIQTGTVDVYVWDVAAATSVKLNTTSAAYESIVLSADYKTVYFTAYDSTGYGQVFLASVTNFNSPTQLTTGTTESHNTITVSKDGSLIVTGVSTETTEEISLLPSAGGTETLLLPSGLEYAWYPNIAPDNSTIVFEGVVSGGYAGIYSVKKDGSGLTRLTNAAGANTSSPNWDWIPSLSPDGTQVSYTRETESGGAENINVIGIGGETDSVLSTALTTDGYSLQSFHLGDYVAYTSYRDTRTGSGNYQLFQVTPTGTGTTQLTTVDEAIWFIFFEE